MLYGENTFHLYFRIYCCFLVFYPARRIFIWSLMFKTYLVTFVIQQLNIINNCYFSFMFLNQVCISKKWLEKFFNNIICIIKIHKFCIMALRVLLIDNFRRNKANRYCSLNSPCTRFLKINYYIPQVRFNLVKLIFYW